MKRAYQVYEDVKDWTIEQGTKGYFFNKKDAENYIKKYKKENLSSGKLAIKTLEILEELKEHKDVKGVLMVSGMQKLTDEEKWALGLVK